MTEASYIPALISFSATRRCTGSVCSASHTCPIPPTPSRCTRRYGPMTWDSPVGSATVVAQGFSERAPASACAASGDSTSARNSPSCAQASSRNALRSWGSRSRAAPTISLIFGHCSCFSTASFFHLPRELTSLALLGFRLSSTRGVLYRLERFFRHRRLRPAQTCGYDSLCTRSSQCRQAILDNHPHPYKGFFDTFPKIV